MTFSSAKGGSGKTVTCAGIGRALSRLGMTVLLVDADWDTAGMSMLFLDRVLEQKQLSLDEALGVFEERRGALTAVSLEKSLDLLPGQYELGALEGNADVLGRIGTAIEEFRVRYDVILVDAQAGSDPAAIEAARASDTVVIVAEYDPVSAQGVKRLEQLYPDVFAPERTWVLYNKVLPDLVPSIGTLLRVERRLTPIPWDVDVVRRFVESELAVDMDVPNPYTLALVENLEPLLGRRIAERVATWRSEAAEAIRAPIRSQLKALEGELDAVTRERIELEELLEFRRRRLATMRVAAVLTTGLALLAVLVFVATSSAGRTSSWAIVAASLGLAATLPLAFVRGLPVFERLLTGGRPERDYQVDLARVMRRYEALEGRRRELIASGGDIAETLGAHAGE